MSIPKLSEVVASAVHVSDMLAELLKALDLDTDLRVSDIEDISELQQKLVQELLVLQQEQDLALATKLGEV